MKQLVLLLTLLGACAADGVPIAALPDVRCAGTPDVTTESFRHVSSRLTAELGSPKHRGVDLLVAASDAAQVVRGDVSYTLADKALEDEDVDVFACDGTWKHVGRARSDGEGHITLALTGAERLPIGVRDMYLSVPGDGTGAPFVAVVAPVEQRLLVTDIDGTLTSDENAFPLALATGDSVGAQAGAATALAANEDLLVVYLTARGRQFTSATRTWLAANGFPRGVLRLADSFVTLPGDATVAFKTASLDALGFEIAGAIGNRASDVAAYAAANVPADKTFVKLPEYADELAGDLDAHRAVGFASYAVLPMF